MEDAMVWFASYQAGFIDTIIWDFFHPRVAKRGGVSEPLDPWYKRRKCGGSRSTASREARGRPRREVDVMPPVGTHLDSLEPEVRKSCFPNDQLAP